MVKAYVGIGSNLGDRQKTIDKAFALLNKVQGVAITKRSSIYETEPLGGPKQGKFLNGVIEIDTELEPLELLDTLQNIENELGRVRSERFGPRTMDLDILFYGDIKMNTIRLTIPHPRIGEREFVLQGLREIAPEREKRI